MGKLILVVYIVLVIVGGLAATCIDRRHGTNWQYNDLNKFEKVVVFFVFFLFFVWVGIIVYALCIIPIH